MMNEQQIKETINLIKQQGELFEIRIYYQTGQTASGYFKDADKAIEALKKYRMKNNGQVCITLNDIVEQCYERQQKDRIVDFAKPTTSRQDINTIRWIMIDLDPIRPSGVSSTDEELKKASEKSKQIYSFLKEKQFYDPIIAISGNGIHMLYKTALSNTTENVDIINDFLKAISMLFTDQDVEVDKQPSKPEGMCKLYGTIVQKGANSAERPHRLSRIIYKPAEIQCNEKQKLIDIGKIYPKKEKTNFIRNDKFDIEKFISENNIEVKEVQQCADQTRYILDHCLFDSSHQNKDACIIVRSDGTICYHCFHNSCSDKHWSDVRLLFDPNYKQYEYNSNNEPEQLDTEIHGKWINEIEYPTEMKERNFSNISELDRLIGGFTYDCITLWAGVSNSGKSTVIGQICRELIKQGKRVWYFAGEHEEQNFKRIIFNQMATDNDLEYKTYYNHSNVGQYFIKKSSLSKFELFFNNNIIVYPNGEKRDIDSIIRSMSYYCKEEQVRDFIIDNLMMIELTKENDLREQMEAVEKLRTFAVVNNCNIHLIAHPRKTSDNTMRLTMFDIAGSMQIVNKAYNVISIIRKDQLREDSEEYRVIEQYCYHNNYNFQNADCILEVLKQKEGAGSGVVCLKFNKQNRTYKELAHEDMSAMITDRKKRINERI